MSKDNDIAELRRRFDAGELHCVNTWTGGAAIAISPTAFRGLLDEIERLRAENGDCHNQCQAAFNMRDARIEKLEAALRKIADCPNIRCPFCEHNAREALEEK